MIAVNAASSRREDTAFRSMYVPAPKPSPAGDAPAVACTCSRQDGHMAAASTAS